MDKLKFLAITFLSFSLFALALSLAYVAYEIGKTSTQLPNILEQVGKTSEKLSPVMKEISEISQTIPPILDQVEATRNEIPAILSSVDKISGAANALSQEAGEVRLIMPEILTELQKTREAIPSMLEQADQVVGKVQKVAKDTGKDVGSGLVKGIVTSPFSIVGGMGKSVASHLGLKNTEALTGEDFELIRANMITVLESEEKDSTISWENPEEKNRGTISLERQFKKDGRTCKEIRVKIWTRKKKIHDVLLEMCPQEDGTWIENKRNIL
jgi:uncharacterized protein YoxC